MAIHLDAAAFAHQLASLVLGTGQFGDAGRQLGVVAVLLLAAPAVEVEVHRRQLAIVVDHEVGADVAHPDVVQFGFDVGDVVAAALLLGDIAFAGAAEHRHRLVGGDGAGDTPKRGLDVFGEVFPDGVLGAEGDEGARVLFPSSGMNQRPASAARALLPANGRPKLAAAPRPATTLSCWRKVRRVGMGSVLCGLEAGPDAHARTHVGLGMSLPGISRV